MADTTPSVGNTEQLMRYWAEGKGATKIRWGQPGDFDRCVEQLSKYERALGVRPGQEHTDKN